VQIAGQLQSTRPEGLEPRVLVGKLDYFVEGLSKYLHTLQLSAAGLEYETEAKSFLVIASEPESLDRLVQDDPTKTFSSLLSYMSVLDCKGLEFDGCVLFGLPTKRTAKLELDLIGQWYTAMTRARM